MVRFTYREREFVFEHPSDSDHIGTAQRKSGAFYERDLLEAIAARELWGTYVDVGAHVGNHAVFFGAFCRSVDLVLFEPSAALHRLLLANLTANNIVANARLAAVGENTGSGFYVEGPPNNSGMGRVAQASDGDIRVVALDDVLQEKHVAVLKIDCEGAEPDILRGAVETIDRCSPLIAAEAATDDALTAQHEILSRLGYQRRGQYCSTPTFVWER